MPRFDSPATGCLIHRLEVEVGNAKETYDPQDFDEPLQFGLEGQRSLGSECGVLSLSITSGHRQMVCSCFP